VPVPVPVSVSVSVSVSVCPPQHYQYIQIHIQIHIQRHIQIYSLTQHCILTHVYSLTCCLCLDHTIRCRALLPPRTSPPPFTADPNKTDNARFFLDVKELPNKLVHVHCVVCYMLQYVTHCSMHHVIKSYSISHHIAFIYSISHHVAFIDSIPYRIALCIMSSSLRGVQNSLI